MASGADVRSPARLYRYLWWVVGGRVQVGRLKARRALKNARSWSRQAGRGPVRWFDELW